MAQKPELALWHAVLAHALADAARGQDISWIGSTDFQIVCNLAGLEADAVLTRFDPERFRRLIKAA